jgi:hypothetical protein
MSNIAGKAYAMNLVTPVKWFWIPINKIIFWSLGIPLLSSKLRGLLTLSMIHYARWVILRADDLLHPCSPRRRSSTVTLPSAFNGTWEQYVDSFSAAIPPTNSLWFRNVGWPTAVPEQLHRYVLHNQASTDYYTMRIDGRLQRSPSAKRQGRLRDSIGKTRKPRLTNPLAIQPCQDLQNDMSQMEDRSCRRHRSHCREAPRRRRSTSRNWVDSAIVPTPKGSYSAPPEGASQC